MSYENSGSGYGIPEVDPKTKARIEELLDDLENPSSKVRADFEKFRAESEEVLRPLREDIERSMALTDDDWRIIVY